LGVDPPSDFHLCLSAGLLGVGVELANYPPNHGRRRFGLFCDFGQGKPL
jgi:hypothetical protein